MRASRWPVHASELAELVHGRLVGDPSAGALRCVTDTRAGLRSGDLFVGLVGPHFDGGAFAQRALAEGASVVLVREGAVAEVGLGQAAVYVPDPLEAMQRLAHSVRLGFSGRVLALTGSHGKTTVKDMLAAAVGGSFRVAQSPMSYNSQVGVALSLLHMDPDAELALIECGISLPGEMDRLRRMVQPDCGVFTTVGDVHAEGLGSRDRIAAEKAKLFSELPEGGFVVVPADQAEARAALELVGAQMVLLGPGGIVSRAPGACVRVDGELVRLALDPEALSAEVLVQDAALAVAAAAALGVPAQRAASGLAGWRPAPMRLEVSVTGRGVTLVNDAYSADPESLMAAVQVLAREGVGGRAIAVLGGMLQLGQARDLAHRRVGQCLAEAGLWMLVGVGEGGRELCVAAVQAGLPTSDVRIVPDVAAAAELLDSVVEAGDRVLLKGSRPDRLERLVRVFFDALAPARLTVDLDALVGNYQAAQELVGPGVMVAPVVKSFGYGIDGVRLAKHLERAGAPFFVVAYPDEGVALRDVGVTAPILVQNTLDAEDEKLVRHGLTAQVSSIAQALALAAEAGRQRRALRVHVKVDTGMGRSGARPEAALALCQAVVAAEWLVLDGLMTHFAASDDPSWDEFTRGQIAKFEGVRQAVLAAGLRVRVCHACNSAGLARFPEAHYDMVRLGLGLFGVSGEAEAAGLAQRPVLRLTSHLLVVKQIEAGEPVGYGLTWRATGPTQVAVVAIGYGDGYPWSASNHGKMLVRGVLCPVIGRVCMDVTLLDVSAADGAAPGDEVVIFGDAPGEPRLADVAAQAQTISYELLTRLSARVRRIFVRSA